MELTSGGRNFSPDPISGHLIRIEREAEHYVGKTAILVSERGEVILVVGVPLGLFF